MLEEAQASNKVFINLLSWETKLGSDFTSENKILFTASQSAHAGLKAYLCKKDKMRPHAHWSFKSIVGTCTTPDTQISVFSVSCFWLKVEVKCVLIHVYSEIHMRLFLVFGVIFISWIKAEQKAKGQTPFLYFFLLKVSQCQRHMNQAHMTKHLFSNLWKFCCLRD